MRLQKEVLKDQTIFHDRKLLMKTTEIKVLSSVLDIPKELAESYETRKKDAERVKELKK